MAVKGKRKNDRSRPDPVVSLTLLSLDPVVSAVVSDPVVSVLSVRPDPVVCAVV